MPFDDPGPLQMSWWVLLFGLIGLVKGIFQYLRFKERYEKEHERGDVPYAGHHYQRRQARKML